MSADDAEAVQAARGGLHTRLWLRLRGSGGVQTAVRGLRRNISPSSSQMMSVMVPTHVPPSIHMLVAPSSLCGHVVGAAALELDNS